MESEDIVKDDKYYEKDSYNKFDTFSVHGLNIEGIKRYYSIPINKKYHHMVKLNKDLDEIISKHLIEKEERKKNDLKEYRLGLLSAGSTSYNNVIIPMLSLTRQPSNFFNDSENEKSFGNDETTKNKKNYMTYRKKNIISGNLKQNQKRRNMSSYSKKANEEEFKDVEKLIPKFHKIKIEKGMMDSNLTKTLKDNFVANYNRSRKLKIRNEFLKLINDKDKIKNI